MRQLFVLDPLGQINPAKDSSAALMQAAHRAGDEVWACTPSDLIARGDEPLAIALPVTPEPWITVGVAERQALAGFDVIWMRKDPPVDEAYLYATHLLEVAERAGVRVLNRPSALRSWNEKLGALRFSRWMAPTLVAGRVSELLLFAEEQQEIVLKPLGGRAGLGVIRVNGQSPGLKALLELVTEQESLPVMAQAFLPSVSEGDKRILLVDGDPLGAINRRPSAGEFRSNLGRGWSGGGHGTHRAGTSDLRGPGPGAAGGGVVLRGHRRDRRHAQRNQRHQPHRGAGSGAADEPAPGGSDDRAVARAGLKFQLVRQHGQLQPHLLQLAFGNGSPHQAGSGGEVQLAAAGMTAADRHPQFRITGAVDPTDRRCVAAPFKRFEGAQPGHRVASRQPGNGRGGVQLFGQRQHGLTLGFGRDRGVQVGEVAVAGQLGLAATPGCQAVAAQLVGDGFHHQFMFAAVLVGAQQLRPGISLAPPCRPGHRCAANRRAG